MVRDGRERARAQHAPGDRGTEAPARREPRSARSRVALSGALIILVALLALAAWRQGATTAPVRSSGQADIGGTFKMVDQSGRPVDQRVLLGKWSAVFFGYTYCPDTCPATLQALAAAQTKLGGSAKDFQVVFISVDPARDTPAQMKLYLSSQGFPQGAIGLTGTPAQVAKVAAAYHVFYAKQGAASQNYAVQHSAAVYLMDPRGQFSRPLDESQTPDVMAGQIKEAMRT